MRSSVPCNSWIDSSLLGIQVVSLMRDYYVSLACLVDFAHSCGFRKFWHAFSGNYGTVRRRRPYVAQVEMTRTARDPIELDESSPLQDTIQDSGGQIFVM